MTDPKKVAHHLLNTATISMLDINSKLSADENEFPTDRSVCSSFHNDNEAISIINPARGPMMIDASTTMAYKFYAPRAMCIANDTCNAPSYHQCSTEPRNVKYTTSSDNYDCYDINTSKHLTKCIVRTDTNCSYQPQFASVASGKNVRDTKVWNAHHVPTSDMFKTSNQGLSALGINHYGYTNSTADAIVSFADMDMSIPIAYSSSNTELLSIMSSLSSKSQTLYDKVQDSAPPTGFNIIAPITGKISNKFGTQLQTLLRHEIVNTNTIPPPSQQYPPKHDWITTTPAQRHDKVSIKMFERICIQRNNTTTAVDYEISNAASFSLGGYCDSVTKSEILNGDIQMYHFISFLPLYFTTGFHNENSAVDHFIVEEECPVHSSLYHDSNTVTARTLSLLPTALLSQNTSIATDKSPKVIHVSPMIGSVTPIPVQVADQLAIANTNITAEDVTNTDLLCVMEDLSVVDTNHDSKLDTYDMF